MPAKLSEARRQLREQIKLLSQLVREDERQKREVAKATEAARPKQPRHITAALGRYRALRAKLTTVQQVLATDPSSHETGHRRSSQCYEADYVLGMETTPFARLIEYHRDSFPDEIGPELIAWSAAYLVPTRRTRCPLPSLHTPTPKTTNL
jgi:hypothetical protein